MMLARSLEREINIRPRDENRILRICLVSPPQERIQEDCGQNRYNLLGRRQNREYRDAENEVVSRYRNVVVA